MRAMFRACRRRVGLIVTAASLVGGAMSVCVMPRPVRGDDRAADRRGGARRQAGATPTPSQLEARRRELRREIDQRVAVALREFGSSVRQLGRLEIPPGVEELKKGSGLYKVPVEGCPRGTALVGAHVQKTETGQWRVTLSSQFEAKFLGTGGEIGTEGEISRSTTNGLTVELKEGCLELDKETRMSNDARLIWQRLFEQLRTVADRIQKLNDIELAIGRSKSSPARPGARRSAPQHGTSR